MDAEHNKKAFHRAMVSAYDFDEARSYLDAIETSTSVLLRSAAVLAAVIAYCRPFVNSKLGKEEKSHPRINLKPSKVLSETEVKLHEQLLGWRNVAIAHSDFDYRPARVLQESDVGYAFISVPASHYVDQVDPKILAIMAEKYRQATLIEAARLKQIIGQIGE